MTTQIENMKNFSGYEYLLIDIANSFGNDKWNFEPRIQWVKDNMDKLESLADSPDCDAKTKPLYLKAVLALRKAQQGLPSGHLVGLDATCSGMQIMSCMTGCISGATATGLVDPENRKDAYSIVTSTMNQQEGILVKVPRGDAKDAVMTSLYGSKAQPKKIFGEETPELNAFYKAMGIVCPGAWTLLDDLLNSWNPFALYHEWVLPDGYVAKVKVMQKVEKRIEVDELAHSTFTYEFNVNEGSKTGLSNVANAVHSVDAYVLRCMERRCNYDAEMVTNASAILVSEMTARMSGKKSVATCNKLDYYIKHYNRSGLADIVILPFITTENVGKLADAHITKLLDIITQMLRHKPFALITIHDAFHSHPNYCNFVRSHYREILADIADSNILNDILSQLYGFPGTFEKLSKPGELAALIRKSNYGLS